MASTPNSTMITVDYSLFIQHDADGRAIRELGKAEAKHTAAAGDLDDARKRLERLEAHLDKTAKKEEKLRDEVKQCKSGIVKSHTALQPQTWFKGGVKAKVADREAELAKTETHMSECRAEEKMLRGHIPQLEREEAATAADEKRKHELEAERTALFEAAVSTAPTEALKALEAQEAHAVGTLKGEQGLVATLTEVSRLCDEARCHLDQSGQLMASAQGLNRAQMVGNFLDGPGPGFDAMEGVEMMGQMARNMQMRKAQAECERGANLLAQAFNMIPPEVRDRYPTIAAELGVVEVPLLRQNGFGNLILEVGMGDLGDLFAGMNAGAKIRQNLMMITDSAAIAGQQHDLVEVLLASLARDVESAKAALQAVRRSIASEKATIFRGLRAEYGAPEDPDELVQRQRELRQERLQQHRQQQQAAATGIPLAVQPPAAGAIQMAVLVNGVAMPVAMGDNGVAVPIQMAPPPPHAYYQNNVERQPVPVPPVQVNRVRHQLYYYDDGICAIM